MKKNIYKCVLAMANGDFLKYFFGCKLRLLRLINFIILKWVKSICYSNEKMVKNRQKIYGFRGIYSTEFGGGHFGPWFFVASS